VPKNSALMGALSVNPCCSHFVQQRNLQVALRNLATIRSGFGFWLRLG